MNNVDRNLAMIFGITGQDGALLAKFLAAKGYDIIGISRNVSSHGTVNLYELSLLNCVELVAGDVTDYDFCQKIIYDYKPVQIYNLSGMSSVSASFSNPHLAFDSIAIGTLNLLESIRRNAPNCRFYNAGSSECFGNILDKPADEDTQLTPISPYGVAKSSAYYLVKTYREVYGLFAVTGIMFNHESNLRPCHFVTKKVTAYVAKLNAGIHDGPLYLGDISICRDWGWAPEYVEAMWGMLQLSTPQDLVISTGILSSLEDFVGFAFDEIGVHWADYVKTQIELLRPLELRRSFGCSQRAYEKLGWKARFRLQDIAREMVRYEIKKLSP